MITLIQLKKIFTQNESGNLYLIKNLYYASIQRIKLR